MVVIPEPQVVHRPVEVRALAFEDGLLAQSQDGIAFFVQAFLLRFQEAPAAQTADGPRVPLLPVTPVGASETNPAHAAAAGGTQTLTAVKAEAMDADFGACQYAVFPKAHN